MKVILKKDIKGVGKTDDILNVSPGHARNYLFPRNLAVEATDQALAELAHKHSNIEKKGEKIRQDAQDVADKLAEKTIKIVAKVGTGSRLYGSITSQDIADAIKAQTAIDVDKRKISVADPIKALGRFSVPVRLHTKVGFDLTVEVVSE